jgi:hypothetical protein
MNILKDEIMDAFITELRERVLSELRQQEKEVQEKYNAIRDLSMKIQGIFPLLSSENRTAIENYMDEKDSLTGNELNYLYLRGIMDGCKLMKLLKII